MGEIRRSTTCPLCGLPFLIVFASGQPLKDKSVIVGCPRTERGIPCLGHVITHLPEQYLVMVPPS